ncbi:APC family permease [Marinomonas sp. A79]|uniref:APC family permease n=2 Tax=Marinomonas vulgaris TaxID=2823372 RepID=A0ABS5HEA8_9GAMM|nr:APC family permease [Marinomonas vulgaris]
MKFKDQLKHGKDSLNIALNGTFFSDLATARSWHKESITPFEKNRVNAPKINHGLLTDALNNTINAWPMFRDAQIDESWAGLIDVTPDSTPVFARIQNLLAFILVSALVIIGLVAITGSSEPHPTLVGTPVDWGFGGVLDGSFIGLVGLALWTMVGVEFICPLINEVKSPKKNIPTAMHLSLVLIFLIFAAFIYGASLYMTTESLLGSPLPFLDYANAVFGKGGLAIATIMAIAATCSTMNTILASVPRMLQGMAEQKQAFPQLKLKNRFDAPWVGILMLTGLTTIPYFAFGIDSLVTLIIAATTSWLLAYSVAHINVIVLRKRMPNHERPYKTPFYPIPQILGIIGMLYIAVNNSPAPEMTQMVYSITGGILLILCVIAALWVKFYMKRGLFEPDHQ